ncbi:MAG: SGNH/GDSL hydrolase family protein [Candidatus Sulfotelmatobacter sp.]
MPVTRDEQREETREVSTRPYRSLLKTFAVRLCVAVTLGVILLCAIELFSYERYSRSQPDVFEPVVQLDFARGASPEEHKFWTEFAQANKVTYHQYVLWRRAPYQGEYISIDEEGVRRTLHTRCDGQTFTIWMFGDSVMWGPGAPDAETIPSFIAEDYQKAGKRVCIVNYAEKGWSNTQEMIELIEQLKHAQRKPDTVLFYDGGTEAFAAYQSGRADVHSNFNLFKGFLDSWGNTQKAGFAYLRQTNTYRFLQKVALKTSSHLEEGKKAARPRDTDALSSAVVVNYLQNMDIVNLLAKQYGFRPVFVWYPNMAVGHKQLTPYEEQVLGFEYRKFPDLGAMYKAVYDRSGEINRPNFYNLADVVDDQKESIYKGISHMNPEGDKLVAGRLFEILQGESLQHGRAVSAGEPTPVRPSPVSPSPVRHSPANPSPAATRPGK